MNRTGHNVYSETDVKRIADFIIQHQATLLVAEEVLDIPHSSIHWLMCNKLLDIDIEAYTQVRVIFNHHKRVKVKPRKRAKEVDRVVTG